jgi:hypothetical protein
VRKKIQLTLLKTYSQFLKVINKSKGMIDKNAFDIYPSRSPEKLKWICKAVFNLVNAGRNLVVKGIC